MDDIIQLLPDVVANQIAAGEVIQRPASVVKELMENAIDAGAGTIHVLITDAGRTAIQVIDDGKGMSATDARLCFERHATSKIHQAEDLFALRTMGFRGEALASIAAVSQVTLKSRREEDEIGSEVRISASQVRSQEPCSCPQGSNFLVENLFYNVPARRKFLKSNTTEMNNILTAFERIVLVYPQLNFTLYSNGTEVLNLRSGTVHQRIADVFGKKISQDLLPVASDTVVCKIAGYVGKPSSAVKKGARQYFFVNGRYMRHPYFHKAVMSVYERMIPAGDQIPYFIYLDVPPESIDVNIHPVKTEIKFENEPVVWQILMASVKEAVGLYSGVTAIDFDVSGRPELPVFGDGTDKPVTTPSVRINPQYNPFRPSARPQKPEFSSEWEKLYETLPQQPADDASLFGELPSGEDGTAVVADRSPVHFQYKGKYILTSVKSGLMIVDQHRAHVRILYEQYLQRQQEKEPVSQKTLFPEVIEFAPAERLQAASVLEELQTMGFDFGDLGGGSYSVNAIPAGLEGLATEQIIREMVTGTVEENRQRGQEIHESVALGLARHAAIPEGQVLGNEEMDDLINRLFACSNVNYTPDGKTIVCILSQEEINRMFGA